MNKSSGLLVFRKTRDRAGSKEILGCRGSKGFEMSRVRCRRSARSLFYHADGTSRKRIVKPCKPFPLMYPSLVHIHEPHTLLTSKHSMSYPKPLMPTSAMPSGVLCLPHPINPVVESMVHLCLDPGLCILRVS